MGAPPHPQDRARVTAGEAAPLTGILRRQIAQTGPLTVAEYMAAALGHPLHGYYTTRDPLGRAGDFITSPEISQVFGELLGLWCADLWLRAGRPAPLRLVELGPGRGTLLADLWRAIAVVPGLREAVRLHLVETSPVLRAAQAAMLERAGAPEPVWHDHVAAALDGPLHGPAIVLANEFFDALPVHQYVRSPAGWRERRVAWDDARGGFAFGLDPAASAGLIQVPESLRTAPQGSLVEVCPLGQSLMAEMARHVAANGLAVLAVDYGYTQSAVGETLQALKGHAPVDPLNDPGSADITAHVDFAALARAATEAGGHVHGPTTQAAFLGRLGLAARTQALVASRPDLAEQTRAASARLVDPARTGMGTLFKVLAVTPPGLEPAGFADG